MENRIVWYGKDMHSTKSWIASSNKWKDVFNKLLSLGVVNNDDIYHYLVSRNQAEDDMTDEQWKECLLAARENAYFQNYVVVDDWKEYMYKGDSYKGYELPKEIYLNKAEGINEIKLKAA